MRVGPCELPRSWPIRNRSTNSVRRPRRARVHAVAVPMAPPPITTASHRPSMRPDRVVRPGWPMLVGMATIGFLGTGLMGTAMAGRLLDSGHRVTVWNRTAERVRPLEAAGAAVAGSPAEAAHGAEFVMTMLTDGPAELDVLFREDGAVAGMPAGTLLIEMSTVGLAPSAGSGSGRRPRSGW